MLHFTTASTERFSALAPDPAGDLERLRRHLGTGSVRAEHLVVAVSVGVTDVGRLALSTHPDGATVVDGDRLELRAMTEGLELTGEDSDPLRKRSARSIPRIRRSCG